MKVKDFQKRQYTTPEIEISKVEKYAVIACSNQDVNEGPGQWDSESNQ